MTESLNPPLRRRRRGIPLAALGLAALAVLGACGSDSKSSSDTTAKTDTASTAAGTTGAAATTEAPTTASAEPVTVRLGYFPNITHAPAIVGVEKGLLPAGARAPTKLETTTFNAGPEAIEALFADCDRRHATSVRTRRSTRYAEVQRRGDPHRVRHAPRAAPASSSSRTSPSAGRPQGQDDRHAAARQHPGRRAAVLAEGAGLQHRHGGRRRRRRSLPQDNADTLDAVRGRRHRRRLGARAVGHPPASRRAAARSSSTRRRCGRTGSSSPRT